MQTAWEGHTEAVQLLLAQGADVNARDNDGKTALMWAKRGGTDLLMAARRMRCKEMVRILEEAGARE